MSTPLSKILALESRLQELCEYLDSGKYWRLFAAQINIHPNEVTKIMETASMNIHFSPSRHLLATWQHTDEATVGAFLEILETINHQTAYSLVTTWLQTPLTKPTNSAPLVWASTNQNDNSTSIRSDEDVKSWLKRNRFEPLESKMEELGAEKVEDLKYMEQEWVMELASTLKPIPRKKFLLEMGIMCSPIVQRKNNNEVTQKKQPGEEQYQQGMSLYWKQRYVNALPLFEKAASLKYPPAFIRLKLIYDKWNDKAKAKVAVEQCTEYAPWFVEQLQGGDMTAQYNLALYYHFISEDYKQAFYWNTKLAQQGFSFAQNDLAYCYQNGQGTTKDPVQAVYWYTKAADQGYATAQCNLGVCYENGEGVEKDLFHAVCWYKKAADLRNVKAQCILGNCYMIGNGVEKDLSQAVYWYKKAADMENATAQCNLGYCYLKGSGVAQDYEQAVYWFKKGAQQNHPRSMFLYGNALYNGRGVAQNYSEAFIWYKKAADEGNTDAQQTLARLARND